MEVVFYLIFFVIGLGAGFIFGRSENKSAKQAKDLAEELKGAQDEMTAHRQQVNEHFMKTGELVNNMTESYRAVYQHLAGGARALCTDDAARVVMRAPTEKLIGGTGGDSGTQEQAETVGSDELKGGNGSDPTETYRGTAAEQTGMPRPGGADEKPRESRTAAPVH